MCGSWLAAALLAASGSGFAQGAAKLERLSEVGPHFRGCFQVAPAALAGSRGEVTVRFTMRRDGSLAGTPRITFINAPAGSAKRAALEQAALAAIERCAPAPLSEGLGQALAGRPFTMRFVIERSEITGEARLQQPFSGGAGRFVSALRHVAPGEKRQLVPGSRPRRLVPR
jgi:TonB family protein